MLVVVIIKFIMLHFRKRMWFLVILSLGCCVKKPKDNLLERFIIACHTNDYQCFKRQYKALRDNFLFGNEQFRIPTYKHYYFEYDGPTCVKLSGLEDSELTRITLDSTSKRYTLVIDFPLRIHQVKKNLKTVKVCAKPQQRFAAPIRSGSTDQGFNRLKRFTGNASIVIIYPYNLQKKSGVTFIYLDDENLDVTLDVPDLSHFQLNSQVEAMLYEWSEWAYDVVQHVDVAESFALPYTNQIAALMEQLPLQRFILLYPEEEYHDLHFSWNGKVK